MNLSQSASSAAVAAVGAQCNGGALTFYSGTMPVSPETALSGNTALVAWTFAATAFGTPVFGSGKETATAAFTSSSASPSASGTVSFARVTQSGGSVVMDLTVGTSGTDIVVGTTTITTGTTVTLSDTISLPAV